MSNKKEIEYHGFSKDVNDYYNHYVSIADAKSGAVLAICFVVFNFLFEQKPVTILENFIFFFSGFLLTASAIYTLLAVYPRTPKEQKGVIFWENVRMHANKKMYFEEVKKLDKQKIEKRYSYQNYNLSNLLHKKHKFIKYAITLFISALILTTILYLSINIPIYVLS